MGAKQNLGPLCEGAPAKRVGERDSFYPKFRVVASSLPQSASLTAPSQREPSVSKNANFAMWRM